MEETIYEFMQEMQTWYRFSSAKLKAAKSSNLTTKNSLKLRALMTAWQSGRYDEDPDCLCRELEMLV